MHAYICVITEITDQNWRIKLFSEEDISLTARVSGEQLNSSYFEFIAHVETWNESYALWEEESISIR